MFIYMVFRMLFSQTVLILISACFNHLSCFVVAAESSILELQQGKVKGIEEISTDGKPIISFYGIPYAKSPVGDLRFENPVKHVSWEGVLEANKEADACLQLDLLSLMQGLYKASGSEDCLYLNVFTPQSQKPDSNLPVMVFIHGGAYVSWSADLFKPYVLLNEDIVLVVIQYRLGVFGFLSTEDETMPGNMGLKDQRLALQWVQENIGSFGGNSKKVTIFGESSGAASVHLQMLSPGSKGLFTGLILQSGSALCPWAVGNQHRNYALEYGHKLGCPLDGNSVAFKTCLKKLEGPALLIESFSHFKWGVTPLGTNPRVDGEFLPDHPATLITTGKYSKVNLMSGVDRDEGTFFTSFMFVNQQLKKYLVEDFSTYAPYSIMVQLESNSANLTQSIFNFYLKGKTIASDPINELSEMFGDSYFKIGSDIAALLHAEEKDINAYLYEFNHEGKRSILDLLGIPFPKSVCHVDDLLYLFSGGPLFGNLPFEREEDIDLRRKMTKLWTNFAKYGNPTPTGSFDFIWRPATSSNFNHLSITTTPTMKKYRRKEALEFWKSLDTNLNHLLTFKDEKSFLKERDEL